MKKTLASLFFAITLGLLTGCGGSTQDQHNKNLKPVSGTAADLNKAAVGAGAAGPGKASAPP